MELGKKRAIALGFFDGVHVGHGALLQETVRAARANNAEPAVVTFDVHPETLIMGRPMPLLNTNADRADVMRRLFGIKDVIYIHFDQRMMRMPWREFLTEFLMKDCGAVHLVAGHDYHFGYKGEGNPSLLKEACAQMGIGCTIVPKVELDETTVSSSYIRTLVAQGEMERAALFLGHPHIMSGRVLQGQKLGRTLGFPTINMQLEDQILHPAQGVYATEAFFEDGTSCLAVTNVGVRPTVDDGGRVWVESFLLDFSGDLYEQTVRLEFHKYLRPEKKFPSLEALTEEIARNVDQARAYFAACNI